MAAAPTGVIAAGRLGGSSTPEFDGLRGLIARVGTPSRAEQRVCSDSEIRAVLRASCRRGTRGKERSLCVPHGIHRQDRPPELGRPPTEMGDLRYGRDTAGEPSTLSVIGRTTSGTSPDIGRYETLVRLRTWRRG